MKAILKLLLAAALCSTLAVTAAALTAEEAGYMDLTSKSGVTARQLAPALGELAPYAEDFIAAERESGVNAVFLAALAAFESGWGRFCIAENNIFGWSGPAFADKSACIAEISRRIAKNYLREGGAYFNGRTLADVNVFYNGSERWLTGMRAMMAQIGTASGCALPDMEPVTANLPYSGGLPFPKQLSGELMKTAAL